MVYYGQRADIILVAIATRVTRNVPPPLVMDLVHGNWRDTLALESTRQPQLHQHGRQKAARQNHDPRVDQLDRVAASR